jgi:hypothetical protein
MDELDLKNLFSKSLLAGLCLGLGVMCSSIIPSTLIQSIVISVIFMGIMELNYPLYTVKCGDSRVMTTIAGYPTPDIFILKLFIKKIIPGNFIGIIISTLCAILIFNRDSIAINEFGFDSGMSWWRIILSSILTGFILDLGTRSFYKTRSRWLMLSVLFIVTVSGLNHSLLDLLKVVYGWTNSALDIITGLKIVILSTLGNFWGSRLRTLLIKEEDDSKNK